MIRQAFFCFSAVSCFIFLFCNKTAAQQESALRVFIEPAYTFNYSSSRITVASSTDHPEHIRKATRGLGLGLGVEWAGDKGCLQLQLKSVRMGHYFMIASKTDSLRVPYSLFVAPYKTNYIVSFSAGKKIPYRACFLKPVVGIDCILFPDYQPGLSAKFVNDLDSMQVDVSGRYTGKPPVLLHAGGHLGYQFRLWKRAWTLEYVLTYTQGFYDLYRFSFRYTTRRNTYWFDAANKGSYLWQGLRLTLALKDPK